MTTRAATAGQVLPLIAACFAALMGFGGLAVDTGYWEYWQQTQQSATDAAAIGGAQTLVKAGCPQQSLAQGAAIADAADNGFSNGGNVAVTVNNPPKSGPLTSDPCAVSVKITSTNVSSFFSRLFGLAGGVAESTDATATVSLNGGACIYMLNPQDNTNLNGGNVQITQCSIQLNGSANFSGGTVTAQGIGEANYSGSNNGGTFPESSPVPALPVANPCPDISGCAYLTANPPALSPCNMTYNGGGQLYQGCYKNLSINGATVTMNPGLYVLEGGSNFNMASVTGNGVTIYVPAGATTNFDKSQSMTLSPPTSGVYTGVTYYQVPSNTGTVNLNGGSMNISGLVYCPTAQLNFNGAQGAYIVLVAAFGNLNSSTGEDYGSPSSGRSLIRTTVLAQ